jgi:predicted GNAT family acetyltransferase
MAVIKLDRTGKNQGAFVLYEEDKQLGEMVVDIAGDSLTVYHTEIIPEAEGKGYAKQLLEAMVTYARENRLSVLPLCPYVLSQFRRHPDQYADIWAKQPDKSLN